MSKNFKKFMDAMEFCEKYELDRVAIDYFDRAEALLSAYKDGFKAASNGIEELMSTADDLDADDIIGLDEVKE